MEKLIKEYLNSQLKFLCEEYLIEKGLAVFEYQADGKTYFRIKIGDKQAYKNLIISLQDLLVFIYTKKENKSSVQKFQSPNTNL